MKKREQSAHRLRQTEIVVNKKQKKQNGLTHVVQNQTNRKQNYEQKNYNDKQHNTDKKRIAFMCSTVCKL